MSGVDRPEDTAMVLSSAEAALLAMHVVAMNAQAWEIEWEDFAQLDEDSVNRLNNAIVDVGKWLSQTLALDERRMDIDVRDLFSRATP